MSSEKQRIEYFDYLRILATFSVVLLHCTGYNEPPQSGSFQWWSGVVYDAIARWGVPVFVMISGALFLGRDIPLKVIFRKYIFRIVTAFAFWSILYARINDPHATLAGFVIDFFHGNYHMWFLYMIVGLYILTPLLKRISASKEATEYFIFLAVVFVFAIPQIISIFEVLPYPLTVISDTLRVINTKFHITMVGGFSAYYLLGYYIAANDISPKHQRWIYIFGTLSLAITIAGSGIFSLHGNDNNEIFVSSMSVNVFSMSAAVFVFGKYQMQKLRMKPEWKQLVIRMSKYSFGAYLVHALISRFLPALVEGQNQLVGRPVMALVVFAISFLISALLNHIPIIKKYIV